MAGPAGSALRDDVLAALRAVVGEEGVLVSSVERSAYAHDSWPLGLIGFAEAGLEPSPPFRTPDAVVRPRSTEEVSRVVRLANEHGFPVVPLGAGSGVCGAAVPVRGGVVLDLKRLDRITRIDARALTVESETGILGQHLEDALAREGLTLGHFPSSIHCSTLGGWLATRSAGQLSTRYGKIEDRVLALEVVLPTGEVVSTVPAPRQAMGPDWNQLFLGSEGTLGVITRATLGVREAPAVRRFLACDFNGMAPGLEAVRTLLRRGARPAAVRLYDELDTLLVAKEGDRHAPRAAEARPLAPWWPLSLFSLAGLSEVLSGIERLGKRAALSHPETANRIARSLGARCLLVLTFEGDPALVSAEERIAREIAAESRGRDLGSEPAERWWRNRYAVSFKQSEVFREGGFSDTLEVATTWDRLLPLYESVRDALSPVGLVLAHVSHAYPEGASIYFTVVANLEGGDARERYRRLWEEGMKATRLAGGAVSHHHGIGLLKADALRASHGALHDVFARVKTALDPRNVMNPGKMGLP